MRGEMDRYIQERLMRAREELAYTETRLIEALQERDRYKEAFDRLVAVFDSMRPKTPESPKPSRTMTREDLEAFFETLFQEGAWPPGSGERPEGRRGRRQSENHPSHPTPDDPSTS